MKILLDLAAADHGTARIGDRRYRDLPEPARTVGVVLEPDAFHPGRSGRNHPCAGGRSLVGRCGGGFGLCRRWPPRSSSFRSGPTRDRLAPVEHVRERVNAAGARS